jgi:hypothetical protein
MTMASTQETARGTLHVPLHGPAAFSRLNWELLMIQLSDRQAIAQ